MNRFKVIKGIDNIFYDTKDKIYYRKIDEYSFERVTDKHEIMIYDKFQKHTHKVVGHRVFLGCIALGTLALYGISKMTKSEELPIEDQNYKDIIEASNDSQFEMSATKDYLVTSLNNNMTIDKNTKKELLPYIEKIANSYLADANIDYSIALSNRLKNYDFTNVQEVDYPRVLGYLLCGDDELATYLGYQLYDTVKDTKSTESEVMGLITLPKRINIFGKYLASNDKLIDILAKEYDLSKNDKQDLQETLEGLLRQDLSKAQTYHRLKPIIMNYYQDVEPDTIDNYILGSQMFYGDFEIFNNSFDSMVTVNTNDKQYGTYAKYYDRYESNGVAPELLYDCTDMEYIKRIKLLIDKYQDNLNYDEIDCRFLMYLYTLTRMNDEQITDYSKIDNYVMAAHMYNTLKESGLDMRFIASYFSNGNINYEELFKNIQVDPNLNDIALFQEMNYIFRLGLGDRTIDPVMYGDFLDNFIDQYADHPEDNRSTWFSFWFPFHEYDNSMFDSLNIKDTELSYSEDTKEAILKYSISKMN